MQLTGSGAMQVTSLQARSTPGVYQRFLLTPNCEYRIFLVGKKRTSPQGTVHLWIGDPQKETIYLSKESLKQDKMTTIIFTFYNNTRKFLHVGALFDKVQQGDQFTLMKLTMTKCREGVTSSRGEPPVLNSKEQRESHEVLKKLYDKTWAEIICIIEQSTATTLAPLWYEILDNEYCKTVRDVIYYDGAAIPYKEPEDFHKAIDFSRSPVLKGIADFEPNAVIEPGAGWGKNLYYLFTRDSSTEIDYYGLELCEQGLNAMTSVMKYCPEYKLEAMKFDFEEPKFKLKRRYDRLLCFTMWSVKEITYLKKMFFYLLLDTAEHIMGIHLEPIGWQITGRGESHSYFNRNLFSILQELESEKRIKITEVRPNMIGIFSRVNAASLLIWEKI